jgi:hypothetical protein
MPGLARGIKDLLTDAIKDVIWRGTVTGTVGNLVTVQRPGMTAADPQSYPRLSSYTPAVSDEVIVLRVGRGYIVCGKVVR